MLHRNIINVEDKILGTLSAENDLLESDTAVHLIVLSKARMNELLEKLSTNMATEKTINTTRNAYKSFASFLAIIYSSIGKLKNFFRIKNTYLCWAKLSSIVNFFK